MDGFPDFGAYTSEFDIYAPVLATSQPYESPSLPWSSSIDASHFGPDSCYDGMLFSGYMLSESHLGSSNLQTSTEQFVGHDVSDPNTTGWYAENQGNLLVTQAGHDESNLISIEAIDVGAAGSSTNTVHSNYARQQSSRQSGGKRCLMLSCEFQYTSHSAYRIHMKSEHQDAFTCNECMYVGKSLYGVGVHAYNTGHASFICKHEDCEKKFSRMDTYQRHQRTHREDAKHFPCKYCKKYRGKNAFKRKDHLTQHVRNYHHIGEGDQVAKCDRKWCPKKDCTESRPATVSIYDSNPGVFTSSKGWVNHMRTVHEESEYSCPQPGCDRVNGKGYFRDADLRAHLRKVHGTDGSFDQSIRHDLWE